MPSLEDQIINNKLYNRLISYIKNGASSSTNRLPSNMNSNMNSMNPQLTRLNQMIASLDGKLQNSLLKSKRFETSRLANDDQTYKTYLKKSNDLVNRQKYVRRTNDLDDYSEFNY